MNKAKIAIAILSIVWAIIISAIALFIPPKGVIDGSVLILIAQLLILVSTIIGINLPIIISKNGDNSNTKVSKE